MPDGGDESARHLDHLGDGGASSVDTYGPHPWSAIDPGGNPVDGMTSTDSGGPALDPDPPRPTGTAHRRTRTSTSPDWWSPPSSATSVRGLVALLTEQRIGRHRMADEIRGRWRSGAGPRASSTSSGGR